MKKLIMMVALMPMLAMAYETWTDPSTGIKWTYEVQDDGTVSLGGGSSSYPAVSKSLTGTLTAPSTINGKSVTSIGSYAFCYCSGLTSVTIPSSVTSIGYEAFYCCSGLTSVTIPSSVTNIGSSAFSFCDGLTSVTIPACVTKLSTTFPSAYTKIKEVVILDGVTSIWSEAFYGCSGLTSVTIPSSVTSIGGSAFWDCSGLTSVTIPASVTSIGNYAFRGCSGLTSVTIPASVTSIGNYAFRGCSRLTSVTIPSSVTSIGSGAFGDCSGLAEILIDLENESYVSSDGILYNKLRTELIQCPGGKVGSVTIPEGVTSIGDDAFWGCSGLKSVTIPSSVTSIGNYAFSGCNRIEIVFFTGDEPQECVRMYFGDGMWYQKVGLPIAYEWAYAGDDGVATITGVRPAWGEVVIPSVINGIPVKSIGSWAFEGCSGLTSVTIPEGVMRIEDGTFAACSGLTSVTIPSSVAKICYVAFSGCSGLKSVTISKGVTSIGNGAFSECSGLTEVTIPEGVTSIGSTAFRDCSGLTSVTIPSSVTSIGDHVLDGCSSLKTIHVSNNGNIDALKRMLYESGFDVDRVTFDHVDAPDPTVQYTISFDAQGGTPAPAAIVREKGKKYGTLPVVSKEGCRFVGWYTDKEVKVLESSVVSSDITLYARWVDAASAADAPAGGKVQVETGLVGWTAKGLPKGLKYDKKTGAITGVPTGAAGDVVVTFTKKGEEPVEFVISVAAISDNAVGKFNGFVFDADGNRGTLQLTTTEAGKLTAKVVTAKGTVSFSGKGWDDVSDAGVYSATLVTKKGDVLALSLDSKAAWDANQVSGTFSSAIGRELVVTAQRNAFGKTWYFNATGSESSGWTLSFAPNAKSAALTVTLKADGSTSIAGKLGAIKASASGCANVGGLSEGAVLADFAPVVKVGGVKKTLSITANLWFDRSDNHPEGVGSAKLIQ